MPKKTHLFNCGRGSFQFLGDKPHILIKKEEEERNAKKDDILTYRENVSHLGLRLKQFHCCLRNDEEEDGDRGKYWERTRRWAGCRHSVIEGKRVMTEPCNLLYLQVPVAGRRCS